MDMLTSRFEEFLRNFNWNQRVHFFQAWRARPPDEPHLTASPTSIAGGVEINTGDDSNPLANNSAALSAWEKEVLSQLRGPQSRPG
ncbi:MAG: hypothetical protein WCC95_02575, partial [Candidatus Sulfotelmatobacter sp.]